MGNGLLTETEYLDRVTLNKLKYYLKFCNDKTLDNAYNYFCFDREFKNLLFSVISYIEDSIKAKIVKYFSQDYDLTDYVNINNFSNRAVRVNNDNISYHELLLKNFEEVLQKNKLDIKDKSLDIIIDYITFGTMSKLYNLLKRQTQKKISDKYNISPNDLNDWLLLLTRLRNMSYHNQILLGKSILKVSLTSIDTEKYNVTKPDSMFVYLLVIKKLIDDENIWKKFKNDLFEIINRYNISLRLLDMDEKFFQD